MNGDARIKTKGNAINRPTKVAAQSMAKTELLFHDMFLTPEVCREGPRRSDIEMGSPRGSQCDGRHKSVGFRKIYRKYGFLATQGQKNHVISDGY